MANIKDVEDLRHPDAAQLLHTPDPARLAYNGPDGLPRVIPVGFLWNGTAIVVCTAVTALKGRGAPRAAQRRLTIDTGGPPAKALLVRGLAGVEIATVWRRNIWLRRRNQCRAPSSPRSRLRSEPRTSRWPESRSLQHGRASTTSAPAGSRPFCVDWSSRLAAERLSTPGGPDQHDDALPVGRELRHGLVHGQISPQEAGFWLNQLRIAQFELRRARRLVLSSASGGSSKQPISPDSSGDCRHAWSAASGVAGFDWRVQLLWHGANLAVQVGNRDAHQSGPCECARRNSEDL